jgi:hypothetical protein
MWDHLGRHALVALEDLAPGGDLCSPTSEDLCIKFFLRAYLFLCRLVFVPVAGTSVACTLDLSFSSWVTKVSVLQVPINIIIIIVNGGPSLCSWSV